MREITLLLQQVEAGAKSPADLLPLLYEELRQLAAAHLSRETPGHTLQPTALVHEVYLRIFGSGDVTFENRRHFFTAAAEAMRRILIESVRRKQADKRGGKNAARESAELAFSTNTSPEDILAVHEALDMLAAEDARAADVVKLHFFAGIELKQCAEIMGVTERTIHRYWKFARAWLYEKLGGRKLATDG